MTHSVSDRPDRYAEGEVETNARCSGRVWIYERTDDHWDMSLDWADIYEKYGSGLSADVPPLQGHRESEG